MSDQNSCEFLEANDIVMATVPVDLQTGANNGDYVSLANAESAVYVLLTAIGTAGDDPVITAQQASDASGTGVKAINFTRVRHKVGATAISAIGNFTLVEQAAASTYDTAGINGAENEALLVVEINAQDLDHANDFTHIRVNCADVGSNAMLGGAIYILKGLRYKRESPTVSHIA